MHISFNTIRHAYHTYIHRDVLKVPRRPVRDWYGGVTIVVVISIGIMFGVLTLIGKTTEDGNFESRTPLMRTTDSAELESMAQYYEEREMRFQTLLETGLEADDPAW
jgi:hypothetical protein